METDKIITIESLEHRKQLVSESRMLVVKYSADWCGPCKTIKPLYVELANENDGVVYSEEDVDNQFGEEPEKIVAVPTFHIYKNSKFIEQFKGSNISNLKLLINKIKETDKIITIESLDHRKQLVSESTMLVVKYSADWCGPCKTIKPLYVELANENDGVVYSEEDVDNQFGEEPEKIVAVPTFHIYKNSKFIEQFKGSNISNLKLLINKIK